MRFILIQLLIKVVTTAELYMPAFIMHLDRCEQNFAYKETHWRTHTLIKRKYRIKKLEN